MRSQWKLGGGCLLACGLVWAQPPACVNGTLGDYVALGAQGCSLNGSVFANFAYTGSASGGAATITADQIAVTPQVVVPATARLNFAAPWTVDKGQTQNSSIRYTIVPPAGATQPQLQLALGWTQVGGIIGRVTADETTNVGDLLVFTKCTEVCQNSSVDSFNFDAVSVVLARHHVTVSGGDGGASLSDFTTMLNRCPLCV